MRGERLEVRGESIYLSEVHAGTSCKQWACLANKGTRLVKQGGDFSCWEDLFCCILLRCCILLLFIATATYGIGVVTYCRCILYEQ